MDMGSLASYLPMLQQMMSQNRPPVATPGINPMATQRPQQLPAGVPFGMMPQISQQMGQRNPTPLFRSNPQNSSSTPAQQPTTSTNSLFGGFLNLPEGDTSLINDGIPFNYFKSMWGI